MRSHPQLIEYLIRALYDSDYTPLAVRHYGAKNDEKMIRWRKHY